MIMDFFASKPCYNSAEIRGAKLSNGDGLTYWLPKYHQMICSQHFIRGKKSDAVISPSFLPTIFSAEAPKAKDIQDLRRHERFLKRKFGKKSTPTTTINCLPAVKALVQTEDVITENQNEINCSASVETVADKMCQVFIFDEDDISPRTLKETFVCVKYVNQGFADVEIQTDISGPVNLVKLSEYKAKKYKNKCCGTDTKEFVEVAVSPNEPINDKAFSVTAKHSCFQGHAASITDKEEFSDLTGVSFETFNFLLKRLNVSDKIKISKEDRLLILLVKLKTGLTFAAMAAFFRVHRTTIAKIFFSCLRQLVQQTKDLVFWPDQETVRATVPNCFKPEYSDTRVIIDCTEFRVEMPASVENKVFCYSHYKQGFTFKVLIGITPSGFISFKSKVYGGRISDSQITVESGLINKLQHGDKVLADKGFPEFQNVIDGCGKNVLLVMPPFLEQKSYFSKEETYQTYNIARVRIHVERIMQRLRTYRILDKIPEYLFYDIDNVLHFCSVLVNLQPPIIAQSGDD